MTERVEARLLGRRLTGTTEVDHRSGWLILLLLSIRRHDDKAMKGLAGEDERAVITSCLTRIDIVR